MSVVLLSRTGDLLLVLNHNCVLGAKCIAGLYS